MRASAVALAVLASVSIASVGGANADEANADEPNADETNADEPGADEPGADEPDADEPDASPVRPRPVHASISVGSYLALTGPATSGAVADADLFPGGAFGRYGVAAHARELERGGRALVTLGVAFEVGASRPRLAMSLRAHLGASVGGATLPAVGGGVRATLVVIGPVALGGLASATLIYDGIDSSLMLSSSLTLGLAR